MAAGHGAGRSSRQSAHATAEGSCHRPVHTQLPKATVRKTKRTRRPRAAVVGMRTQPPRAAARQNNTRASRA
eukprot:6122038-Alexandrium_andersonii.AAC.1